MVPGSKTESMPWYRLMKANDFLCRVDQFLFFLMYLGRRCGRVMLSTILLLENSLSNSLATHASFPYLAAVSLIPLFLLNLSSRDPLSMSVPGSHMKKAGNVSQIKVE